MPPLISPELMAQMIQARSMPMALSTPGTPTPAPDNQTGMFQRAHALRAGKPGKGQLMPQGGPPASGPLAQSLSGQKVKAMMLDAIDPDDEHRQKFQDAMKDESVTPQMFEQALRLHHEARQPKPQAAPLNFGDQQPQNPNAGTMSIAPMGRNPAVQQTRQAEWNAHKQGMNVHTLPGNDQGFMVSGIGTQQTTDTDDVVKSVNEFEGRFNNGQPDAELRAIAQQHGAAGVQSYLRQFQVEQSKAEHESTVEHRQARNDEFTQNARRLDEARRLRDELVSKDPMLKSGNPELMRQSPGFEQVQKLDGTIANLQQQVIGGNEPTRPQQHSQSALNWNGQQFNAGQVVKGVDGKAYKLTGRLHPDGSPEVVPQ